MKINNGLKKALSSKMIMLQDRKFLKYLLKVCLAKSPKRRITSPKGHGS